MGIDLISEMFAASRSTFWGCIVFASGVVCGTTIVVILHTGDIDIESVAIYPVAAMVLIPYTIAKFWGLILLPLYAVVFYGLIWLDWPRMLNFALLAISTSLVCVVTMRNELLCSNGIIAFFISVELLLVVMLVAGIILERTGDKSDGLD
jgi:hypothetical protein